MNGWSFCIVTAEGNDNVLQKCIESIKNEFCVEQNYEIIVVGNTNIKNDNFTKLLSFNEEVFNFSISNIKNAIKTKSFKSIFFKTGAICHKKNLAAKNAEYDKLCVMHDYVGLEKNWLSGWKQFGYDWNVAMNIIMNQNGLRHRDWLVWDFPNIGAGLLSYDKYSQYMYISGTYFCVKKDFFINNLLNEKLFWGEGEDVEWSLRVRNKTRFV